MCCKYTKVAEVRSQLWRRLEIEGLASDGLQFTRKMGWGLTCGDPARGQGTNSSAGGAHRWGITIKGEEMKGSHIGVGVGVEGSVQWRDGEASQGWGVRARGNRCAQSKRQR